MESIGRAERSFCQAEEEVFRPAVDVLGQLDAPIDTIVETADDRVLQTARGVPRERALAQTA